MKHSKNLIIIMIIASSFLFAGCDILGILLGTNCDLLPDSAHCYQAAGGQSGDSSNCDKIKPPAEFAKMGSNPPRDKCYMMIAENTGDYSYCKKMKGGYGSYEPSECISEIAAWNADPKGCKMLTGAAYNSCKEALGNALTPERMSKLDDELSETKKALEDDPTNAELKQKLKALQTEQAEKMEFMSSSNRQDYTRSKVNDIIGDVDDEDVKSSIVKDYLKIKGANPNMNFDQLMGQLQKVKQEKEFIKQLDDEANTLVDLIKNSASDYADEKKQELIDAATEKGWDYIKNKGEGAGYTWHIQKLEAMKEKYDKASENYKALTEKIEKFKKVYDEVSGVYKKVDEYNKMVKEGKINEGQAKVLKGGVLLGKGLEYATSYVPVFGSTISTVSKETFEVTLKVAKKRAERSNSLQKCMDDPEHCDPSTITAY